MITLDTETVGFTGPIVLLQWAEGDGEVHLHSPMRSPISETLDAIELIIKDEVLGFNLAFDIFKLQQAWTTLRLLKERIGSAAKPIDHIDAYAECEPPARDGPCLKPSSALDLMLHARKGPWQNLMARDPITVRRVPAQIAALVRDELERSIKIPNIFFAKSKDGRRWKIKERKDPDWVDIELAFHPSSALKALATEELGLDPAETLVFKDVEVDRKFLPIENQFAPFALSVGRPGRWNGAWPEVIRHHDSHWAFNPLARKYATLDIEYPRRLRERWGFPPFGDDDSMLACLSGAMRWKGFAVNLKGIAALRRKAQRKSELAPRAPRQVMAYVKEMLAEEEQIVLLDKKTGNLTTKRVVLEEIAKLRECPLCSEGVKHAECIIRQHRAAKRAQLVLDARKGKKEVEIYDKLLLAGRFHVSTNVIGTRSTRQSGGTVSEGKAGRKSGNLNPQGINKRKIIRAQFPLAFTEALARINGIHTGWGELGYPVAPERLVGGDFDSFEVTIADAYYSDDQLHQDLTAFELDRAGKVTNKIQKIHAIIGTLVYPHDCSDPKTCAETNPRCPKPRTYWSIRDTDGRDPDLYTRAKSAFFALIYFGNEHTLAERLGIPLEDGGVAYRAIMARYKVMGAKREEFFERFCPLRQPDGIGSKVYWVKPNESVTSMIGFERFFTLENRVIRAIYDLADDIPPEWREFKIKVRRRDRDQTVANAVRSALLAAAFGLQGQNMRAAGNHVIQSTGAGLTKRLQRRIWDLQPVGIHPWIVRPMNVHDELPTAIAPVVESRVAEIQKLFIQEHKSLIPLLGMKWKRMNNWAGK